MKTISLLLIISLSVNVCCAGAVTQLLMITGEKTTRKIFSIIGRGGFTDGLTSFSVMEGGSVFLNIGATDINNYVIRWRFENSPLAEFSGKTKIISTHDERFRDRLEMEDWSGSLTITHITTDLSGLYEVIVDSNSGTHTIHRSFTVTVSDADLSSDASSAVKGGTCVGVLLVVAAACVWSQIL
ncbi:uncharacterized protein LOC130548439 isoform X3 [Triplophysa rosa]|uniref:uncharacterized protein LOC130548439 isoform X3 n=1 Tax=Triplophysa rosa TaxID=992332 RepID=UPI00254631CB|nr:uncharacterized protein LOC130548439 isoform X3 [Triplophysa rosa]